MKLILICFIFVSVTANASEYDRYRQDVIRDYNDGAISRWNARVERKESDEVRRVREEVREINRYNLYRYGEDYKGEVITIEREGYRIND